MGNTYRIPVCGKCKGEKNRVRLKSGGYKYVCYCEEWRAQLRMMEAARDAEARRHRRNGVRSETVGVESK